MRRVTLSLVVLAIVGLAASTALAGTSSPTVSLHLGTTLVGHHGGHGYSYGHGGYAHRSYGYGYRSPYRSYRYGHGMGYRYIHPPVVIPFPGHPPVVHPPIYRHRYYYRPHSGIHYRGPGFGISIGF
jgi:hypothetical protein